MTEFFQCMQFGLKVCQGQGSETRKPGTVKDKSNLPCTTARTQADRRKWGFPIIGDARLDARNRVNKVARATYVSNHEREAVADAFEIAFGD